MVFVKIKLFSDPESYQLNDLWQVFIDPERRENAKKVRKLLVDRYNLIEGKNFRPNSTTANLLKNIVFVKKIR